MSTSVRCSNCGEQVLLQEGSPSVCPECSAPLELTIHLDSGRVSAASPLILVVDDDRDSREVARAILEAAGYTVADASNGPDAALMAAELLPTFVLLDERMPAMSGADTAKLLRRLSPESLIVAFTAILDERPDWADALIVKDRIDELATVLASLRDFDAAGAPRRREVGEKP
jgi:CheY-like chemotaxis protein